MKPLSALLHMSPKPLAQSALAACCFLPVDAADPQHGQSTYVVPDGMVNGGQILTTSCP
jgi:hypothetical protein